MPEQDINWPFIRTRGQKDKQQKVRVSSTVFWIGTERGTLCIQDTLHTVRTRTFHMQSRMTVTRWLHVLASSKNEALMLGFCSCILAVKYDGRLD